MSVSKSPFGKSFEFSLDENNELEKLKRFCSNERKNILVLGLGFVGTAMIAALSISKDKNKKHLYNVIGVDLGDKENYWKIGSVNSGVPPVKSTDTKILDAFNRGKNAGNILATYSHHAFKFADVIVVDIPLDIEKPETAELSFSSLSYDNFSSSISEIAKNCNEDALVILETTVPPGTTEKVVEPIFRTIFELRNLDFSKLKLAHSYERVMPGANYLDSITKSYRVFAASNVNSSNATREFLETFIDTKNFPLSELECPTASEMAKVLENSYRAANIAFIREWGQFAQDAGVDLYDIIEAIRVRSTHNNIMWPGFGVGGYCLSKDSLLADWSAKNHFKNKCGLKSSVNSVKINDRMPEDTVSLIKNKVGKLKGRTITLLGISYLNDVADTRFSPSYIFSKICMKEGAKMIFHDPLVEFWQEMELKICNNISDLKVHKHDIVVFAVRHKDYLELPVTSMLSYFPDSVLFVDAFNILNKDKIKKIKEYGKEIIGIGKGDLNTLQKRF